MQETGAFLLLFAYFLGVYLTGRIVSSLLLRFSTSSSDLHLGLDTLSAFLTAACTANFSLAYSLGGEALLGVAFFVGGEAIARGVRGGSGNTLFLFGRYTKEKNFQVDTVLWTLLIQSLGVALFFKMLPWMHWLGIVATDNMAPNAPCDSIVKAGLGFGCLIEAFGGILYALCELQPVLSNQQADGLIKNAVLSAITVYFIYDTGFYINPLNALAWRFTCPGEKAATLVLVYGVAPLLAYLATNWLWTSVILGTSFKAHRQHADASRAVDVTLKKAI